VWWLQEVPTGEAVFTKGYWLWAPYVIHTVGPTWAGGKKGTTRLLLLPCLVFMEYPRF
jgi:O-acetyl-ADP-ribose deacetylase (regulator of RNase III)